MLKSSSRSCRKRVFRRCMWCLNLAPDGGARKPLLPVLAPGLSPSIISRPLSAFNVLRCDLQGDLHQLVSEIGSLLSVTPQPPASYQEYVEDIALATSANQSAPSGLPTSERVVYSSSGRDLGFDFRGSKAQLWQNVGGVDKPISEYGTGVLTFESGGVLNIQRSNTDGRYEVTLQAYVFGGTETTAIPRDDLIPGLRRLRLSCETKAAGAEHTLRFVLKNQKTNKWVAQDERTITSNAWTPIKIYFQIPPTEECSLRIDDLNVTHAPSSVQIRNLLLAERVS
jgi:hypothetical protein